MTYALSDGIFQVMKVNVKAASGTFSTPKIHIGPDSDRYSSGSGPTSLNKNPIPAILPALFTRFLSLNPQLTIRRFKCPETTGVRPMK